MTEKLTVLRIGGSLFAVLAIVGLTGCGSMIGTDGFNDDDLAGQPADEAVMSRIMGGIGGVDTNREPINYKPRSPLAMPPKGADLPAPEGKDSAQANTAAWPDNPEDLNRKRQQEASLREIERMESDSNYRLSKDEMEAGRIPGKRKRAPLTYEERRDADTAQPRRLTPAEMRGKRVATPESITYAPGEVPQRRYLVEPPTTYREPAPNVPVEAPKDKSGLNSWIGDLF